MYVVSHRVPVVTYVRRIKHAYDSFAGLQQTGVIRRNAMLAAFLICDWGALLQGRACGKEA